jgi:endoglucanase
MDTIGFIATHIEKEGFVRFGKIGGLRPSSILHTPVRFKNGVRGLVSLNEKTDAKKMTLDDLYLDIGAKDEAEAKSMICIGDTAVFDGQAFSAGRRLVSPYMDNRISCVVLLMAREQLGQTDNDLYFVFTVQEELGLRGAKTAAYSIDPDYGIAVDVTTDGDELGTRHEGSSVCGGGAAIKVMDHSVICHPQVVEKLESLAAREGIPAQAVM